MEALRELAMERSGEVLKHNQIPEKDLESFPQQAIIAGFRKYTL
jgi:hypothetical protein